MEGEGVIDRVCAIAGTKARAVSAGSIRAFPSGRRKLCDCAGAN